MRAGAVAQLLLGLGQADVDAGFARPGAGQQELERSVGGEPPGRKAHPVDECVLERVGCVEGCAQAPEEQVELRGHQGLDQAAHH